MEPKFRGKVETGLYSNQWIKGNYYIRKFDENYLIKDYIIYRDQVAYPIKENTLNTFTGIHDINGKEIFDGDIVRYSNKNLTGDSYGVIQYGNKNSYLSYYIQFYKYDGNIVRGDKRYNRKLQKSSESNVYEIIGNIIDNPELLTDFSENVRINDRIIKFRAVRINAVDYTWYFGNYYYERNITEDKQTTIHYIHSAETGATVINPNTLCQYTGFNDSTGTEIYEKDVIELTDKGLIGIVYWDAPSGSYRVIYDTTIPKGASLAESIGLNPETVKISGNYFTYPRLRILLENHLNAQ